MQPPDLRYIAKSTILKYLVCSSDISRDHLVMLEYFESFGQGVFGDEILSQIIEDFPGELTDELLLVLSPPHLRHLKLTRCSRLSCSGLQKTIAKCVQLQALDFSECLHLLHPTVFCCLKDKAVNLVSLSLENSQVVSDDIVQVVLMCCPGLKHLNLSSCSNITDAAFALFNSESSTSSTACTNSPSSKTSSHPGCNLTSVDISGCQSLSTTTVKYLVGLCGAKLTSINLAWTGVNCTALLYLAGLNLDEVARLVHETDHASANSDEEATKDLCCYDNHCHNYQFTPECDGNDSSSDRCTMYMPRSKDGKYQTELQNQQATACSEENDYGLQNEFIWSQSFQHSTQHDDVVSQTYLSSTSPAEGMLAGHSNDCDESLLNEIELSGLKDVLPVTRKSSLLLSSETEHLQPTNETSDEESDDSFKTASEELDLTTCFLSGEDTSFPFSEERNLSCEEPLKMQEKCSSHEHGQGGILKSAGAKNLCWNVPARNDSTSNMLEISESSCKEVCVSGDGLMLSCDEGETRRESQMFGHEYHVIRNPAVISEQSHKELATEDIYQDCFDMESHPVMTCKEEMIKKCGRSTVNTQDGHIAIMSHMTVNGKESNYPTIPCEKVKEDEVKCDQSYYPIMPCARVDHAGSECCIKLPCDIDIVKESDYPNVPVPFSETVHKESDCENDEDVKSKNPRILVQCKVESIEPVCSGTLDVKDTNNRCTCSFPNMPCVVHESQKPSTYSVMPHSDGKSNGFNYNIKPCWGDTGVIPDVPCKKQTDRQSNELFVKCSKTVKSRNLDCPPSHHGVLQVADLLQAQMYQPQITSLDISNIVYQSKALGEACLKVFSKACNRLKYFAVSWTGLDDEMLTYLLKNERELESLSLVDCETLSDLSVCTIPVYCPKLTSFDLKGMCYVMDHGIMPLTRSNDLETLRLAEAAITDSTLESIAKGCGAKLNVLDISWCEDITDRGMSMIANCCPTLQHLGLRQCVASHLTLNALAANCHLVSSLNIAGVDSLTDTALGNLAENMPLLREIDASWNSSLSDIGVSALLECCTKLNKAVLCGLKRISSQPFLAIIGDLGRWYLLEQLWKTNARSLSVVLEGKLALKPCNSETAKSLGDQIPCRSMSYAPLLRQVLLEYSDKVNDDHLAAIVAVCRGTLFAKDYYGQPVEPKWIFKSG